MELKEFIRDVILDVIEGIELAQAELNNRKIKAIVNPTRDQHLGTSIKGSVFDYYETNKIEIEAIVVTVKGSGIGSSIKVLSGELKKSTENTSRIRFSVPILLPPTILPEDFIEND